MKGKWISAVLILLLLAAQAIGFTSAAAEEPRNLTVWLPPLAAEETLDMSFWDEQLAPWSEANNCTVTIEIVPWSNFVEKYLTGISADMGPDVGYMYMEMVSDFINMGALAPLDDYLTQEDRDNYLYLSNGFIQGKHYMLPIIVGNPRILFCNMDVLEASGFTRPPQTWDELVEYGLKIKEDSPEIMPFVLGWAHPAIGALNTLFFPFLWQAGGDIISPESEWIFNSEAGVRAATFVKDLMHEYQILPETSTSFVEGDTQNLFLEGKAAMTILGSRRSNLADQAGFKWDFTTSLIDEQGGTFVASDSLVLMSKAKDPELAFDLMRYMTSGPVMTAFHQNVSPNPPVARDEAYNDNPRYENMYTNESEYFHTLPAVDGLTNVLDMLYKNLQLVMLNEMEPQAALDEAVDYANSLQ